MNLQRCFGLLALFSFTALGAIGGSGGDALAAAEVVEIPGFEEPNTPGAPGAPEAAPNVKSILGNAPDLNTITYVRTFVPGGTPQVVLILIPGFLGGAPTFTPLAEQLVDAFSGDLEVWAVDRRPNQLEDRRGGVHAATGTTQALLEGTQFYFPDSDENPTGNFPGDEDFDVNENGVLDPPFELPDALGVSRSFVRLTHDEVRFLAHWGVDTYVRDWNILVEKARAIVGETGVVVFGGHSLGTTWTGIFAAYDFDPGPGVDAAHDKVDGLLLLEGGGPGTGNNPPTLSEYQAEVADLASPGGSDVFLESTFGGLLPVVDLGAAGELGGVAGTFDPDSPSLLQRTSFGAVLSLIIQVPTTNRSAVGFFLDDEFTPNVAFRTSLGFSDDGVNAFIPPLDAYIPVGETPRTWKDFDDPTLPTCPPAIQTVSPGCAIIDNGPRPGPTDPPAQWGLEREVTDIEDMLSLLFTNGNLSEWYFVGGRASLDFRFGRDSTSLGDESLLAVTQNSNMDAPVLAIGGSNGLAPTEASFANYLGSIATPDSDKRIELLEGYAHFDMLTASNNEAVPILTGWIDDLLARNQPPTTKDADKDAKDKDKDKDSKDADKDKG